MIEVEDRDGIAIWRLAHGKANALDDEICLAIVEQLADHARSESRAIVLTGNGRMFCAGVDLKRVFDGGVTYLEAFLPRLGAAFDVLFRHPKPVVAAIDGHAIAGGCILACTADRRLLADGTAHLGVPELRVGVPFPTMALEILRYAVEPRRLAEIVLSGETFEPAGALERGLADEIVAADALLDEAIAAADRLAGLGRLFALTKRQLRGEVFDRIRTGAERNEADVAAIWTDPATLDAMRAYVERTLGKET